MAKKEKKPKKEKPSKKGASEQLPSGQEIDAVKAFIVVMFLLILGLCAVIVYTMGDVTKYEGGIAQARKLAPNLVKTSLEVQEYLKLIKDTGETVLMNYPERFFGRIYTTPEIAVPKEQVLLRDMKEVKIRRPHKYMEMSWDIDITGLTRNQAALFLHGVETDSPKAKAIELSMRRSRKKDAPEDTWDGRFVVGYRTALTGK
jgi:hypothetical protein